MRPSWRSAVLIAVLACGLPGTARPASLTLDKEPVVLGRVESVGVIVKVDEPAGTADRPLRLAVNVGSFGDITHTGPGTYRTVYVPPTTRFPQVALVAVWRETGPEAPIDFLRIPLYGIAKIPVQSTKRTEIRVQIGNAEFGPEQTDNKGKATITAEVPPGVSDAVVLVKDKANVTASRKVPIEVPPYNRLTAAVVPHAVVADGRSWARIEVFYDLGGISVPPQQVKVVPDLGAVSFLSAAEGRYVYRYVPPVGATASEVAFKLAIENDQDASAHSKLLLGLPPPAQLVVRPPDTLMACDGKSEAPVSILALDDAGMGLAAQPVVVTANGQQLKGLTYQGNGLYQVSFVAPDHYPPGGLVQLVATVQRPKGEVVIGTANYKVKASPSPKSVAAHFSPSPVPTDGHTETRLELDVKDGAGMPLPKVQLTLVASHGSVGKLTDLGEGRYEATFVPPPSLPDDDPELRVVDLAGGFDRTLKVPVRADPHRLLLGIRAGATYSLGDQLGPRVGGDLWSSFQVQNISLGIGLTGHWAQATQTVSSGPFVSRSKVSYIPVTLRLGVELWASRRLSTTLGFGGQATYATYETSLTGTRQHGLGFGGLGFFAFGIALGPGQAFVELDYAMAPVDEEHSFHIEAGGLGLEIGYRFGVL